jgi:hypothetical protein
MHVRTGTLDLVPSLEESAVEADEGQQPHAGHHHMPYYLTYLPKGRIYTVHLAQQHRHRVQPNGRMDAGRPQPRRPGLT